MIELRFPEAPVALDPLGHQGEDLLVQVYRPGLRPGRTAHNASVLEHPQMLVNRLERHLVRLGEPVDRHVGLGEPGLQHFQVALGF